MTTPETPTTTTPEHKRAEVALPAGEQLFAMIEARGSMLPVELIEKARNVTTAYDESMRVLSAPAEESVRQAADTEIDRRFGELLTLSTPRIIEAEFNGPYSEQVSWIEVSSHVRDTLGVPAISDRDMRMNELPLSGDEAAHYKRMKLQKQASDLIREWSVGVNEQFMGPYKQEAREKAGTFIAQKKSEASRAESETPSKEHDDLESTMQTTADHVDKALSELEKSSPRLLGRLMLTKRKQWEHDISPQAKAREIDQWLNTLASTIERAVSPKQPGLHDASFHDERESIEKGIKEITSEVYRRYRDTLNSGKLLSEFTDLIAANLIQQGLADAMSKISGGPAERSPSSFSDEVVKKVDREVSELREQGLSDRQIKVKLYTKYHPDSGKNGDEDTDESSQYVSHLFKPEKTKGQ